MKTEELRIGNYVELEGVYSKLNNTTFKAIIDGRYNELKPIELTEEILLKCGFEKIENNWKVLTYHSVFYFSWERLAGSAFSLEKESIYLPNIKHLHQLQNLYFALTNEELQIDL